MKEGTDHYKKQRRKHAISLSSFADAKKSTYDKSAKIAKQFNLNAKKVNKYRKWKQREIGDATPSFTSLNVHPHDLESDQQREQQQRGQEEIEPDTQDSDGAVEEQEPAEDRHAAKNAKIRHAGQRGTGDETHSNTKPAKKQKPRSVIERLAQKNADRESERQKERERIQAEREERERGIQAAKKKRLQYTKSIKKKTNKGQPLMRDRIEQLLGKIQAQR
mmetsp:Transcript_4258/g.4912  ORF Transcript_4258/g.4912 Transcript_4258/m.4912 type:complete len:220 (-) Transcript_4258:496-1155(-)|eukprot:CAMPEP_0197852360 /NCGR_PEP_ID=MMETSP1438-20131217/20359_1 /TAXON_ID=1461541 /ORGANISM="Pterosperma sp., Strain CCMP1384" /LENGTH=219 /DNA_ID=CAMNT_0043466365 /DNA_START=124 /DNA_END=783 /DNA_ORIENTATION=-